MTIHITGQRANTAPFSAEERAICAGTAHTVEAISSPTMSPPRAACQAGRFSIPRRTRTVATGSIATRKDSVRLPPTGVNNC